MITLGKVRRKVYRHALYYLWNYIENLVWLWYKKFYQKHYMVKSNRVMPLKFWRKKQFSMYNHSINPVGRTNHDIFITGKQSGNVYSPIFS